MSTNNTSCTSGLGNTKPDHSRCRRWVFTLNNWNDDISIGVLLSLITHTSCGGGLIPPVCLLVGS